MLLLIVPGVLLAIRWSIAQPLLVGRHVPAIDAMRESWEKTRGHGVPIFLAGLVIVVPMLILIFGIAFAGTDQESMGTGLFALFGINLVSNAASVVMTAMVAALLGLIDPPGHGVGDVFS
jgi:membrane-anchored glycerophosphoryl diester phosphodiesterase (GDPDase)